jgi:hypothetical protein
MNLSQLYELKNEINRNPNKVISKLVLLSVLDSHIQALTPSNDVEVIQDSKPLETPFKSAYERGENQEIRLPPTKEQVRRAYHV